MFGENVRKLREYRRFTMAELARAAGIEFNTVRRVETGLHAGMSVENAVRVARVLGTTVEALVEGNGLPFEEN